MHQFIKFNDRHDAGIQLANLLDDYNNDPEVIVLGIPRGGVPVAYEVAKKLGLALDIFIVRKLGVPNNKELAMGALASGNVIIFNDQIISEYDISKKEIDAVISEEKTELKRRESTYLQGKKPVDVSQKKIILVDDGIATGSSIQSAIAALRKLNPAEIIIAVPVAPYDTINELTPLVDKIFCLYPQKIFHGVGAFYSDFSQTTDQQVMDCLKKDKYSH